MVSITPFSPSVSTFSWPLGRLEVSLRTSLKAISVSVVSTVVLARLMEMTVDSLTLESRLGVTLSSGSRTISPVSSTSLTVVMLAFSPRTTRDLPLTLTVT